MNIQNAREFWSWNKPDNLIFRLVKTAMYATGFDMDFSHGNWFRDKTCPDCMNDDERFRFWVLSFYRDGRRVYHKSSGRWQTSWHPGEPKCCVLCEADVKRYMYKLDSDTERRMIEDQIIDAQEYLMAKWSRSSAVRAKSL